MPQSLCRNPLSENFVEIGHSERELRQSVSTKIDDKVGNQSFGTSSIYQHARVNDQSTAIEGFLTNLTQRSLRSESFIKTGLKKSR